MATTLNPFRQAASEIAGGLPSLTKQSIGIVNLAPLLELLLGKILERCANKTASQLKASARSAGGPLGFLSPSRRTITAEATASIRAHYGTRKEIGRVQFNDLRDQLVNQVVSVTAAADVPRIEAVRATAPHPRGIQS